MTELFILFSGAVFVPLVEALNSKSKEELPPGSRRRADKNEEDITIVLLHKDINSLQTRSLIASLRSINDFVQVFDQEDDALAFIDSVCEEKILFIVDRIFDRLRDVVDALKQVEAIVIFALESSGQFPVRISATCSTESQLLDETKSICRQIYSQMTVLSIYNQRKKEKFDLSEQAGSFLFFQMFKAAFQKIPKNPESKKLMIRKYDSYYAGNPQVRQEIADFQLNYKSHDALRWYTNSSFIYRLINKAVRTENITTLCYLHFYINDLSQQLRKEFEKLRKKGPKSIVRFYRGFTATREILERFERNIGSLVLTNGYLSVTRHRERACACLTKQRLQFDAEKVLFEYAVDLAHVESVVFAEIVERDKFIEDNEILFDLGTVFKIQSCVFDSKEKLWLINACATDEGVDIVSDYIRYQAAKMAESNLVLMLGHLMIEAGDYDKAERYFDAILHSSIPNDEEIACIYYNMGRVYRLKREYPHALEYLNEAYTSHFKARPPRIVSAAKAMNAIGIVYMEQDRKLDAMDSFEGALKLYTKSIQANHPDVAGTLINLANIYCEQGNCDDALSCFKQAQYIYERHLPQNHPNKALLFHNLGNFHYREHQWDAALKAYQQALAINEATLPPNHPDISKNNHKIYMVQTMMKSPPGANAKDALTLKYESGVINTPTESITINPFPSAAVETDEDWEAKMELIELHNC